MNNSIKIKKNLYKKHILIIKNKTANITIKK